jgi:hypothetical protein
MKGRLGASGSFSMFKKFLMFSAPALAFALAATQDASAQLAITEVHWNPDAEDDGREWIELYNFSNTPVDINGWRLTNATGTQVHTFSGTTPIAPRDFRILVSRGDTNRVTATQATQLFSQEWLNGQTDTRVLAIDNTAFGNGTDDVLLLNGSQAWSVASNAPANVYLAGQQVTNNTYFDPESPIHRVGADPVGRFANDLGFELSSTTGINADPGRRSNSHLAVSTLSAAGQAFLNGVLAGHPELNTLLPLYDADAPDFGSPLSDQYNPTGAATNSVAVTEVHWNADGEDNGREWVELYNYGTTSVNLTGWTLTDEDGDSAALSGTIPSDGYLILVTGGKGTLSISAAQAKEIFEEEWLGGVADARVVGVTNIAFGNGTDQVTLLNGSTVAFRMGYSVEPFRDPTGLAEDANVFLTGNNFSLRDFLGVRNIVPSGLDPFYGDLGFELSSRDPARRLNNHLAVSSLSTQGTTFLNSVGLGGRLGDYDADVADFGSPLAFALPVPMLPGHQVLTLGGLLAVVGLTASAHLARQRRSKRH